MRERLKLLAAFAAIYVIWGSTFLSIRMALASLPPLTLAACRFLGAGLVLFIASWSRGAGLPTWSQWRAAAVVGILLLVSGNGIVVWSMQHVPSGLAAVLVGTVPLWMAVFEGRPRQSSPSSTFWLGPLIGLSGVVLMVGPTHVLGGNRPDLIGCLALITASASWAIGTLYGRRARLPRDPFMAAACEMLAGGLCLAVLAVLFRERSLTAMALMGMKPLVSMVYLIGFGSVIGFSAYVWLIPRVSMRVLSTYAFVNPVVALLLGWMFAGETLTLRSVVAAGLIVSAVIVMLRRQPTDAPAEL